MATFNKSAGVSISGTTGNDLILILDGTAADDGAINGGTGIDELRFASAVDGDLLIIDESLITGIESVVIGTGTAATAALTSTTALDIDATFAEKALSMTGNSGDNMILGTLFADTITGGVGSDSLYGGADNDRFIVASGAEHPLGEIIDGEEGFDTIFFTSTTANDTLTLRENDDIEAVVIGTAAGVTTGTVAINVDASGMFNFFGVSITGNAGNNRLTGTAYADVLIGGAGADTLIGGAGADTLNGGTGADSMSGGAGNDLFILGSLAEMVAGEVLDAGSGTDTLRLETAAAATSVVLTSAMIGFEVFEFGSALQATSVNINAQASTGPMTIRGTNAANAIVGTAGSDHLIGGGGNDVFVISNVDDYDSSEIISGGIGLDEIRFAAATGTLVLGDSVEVERIVIAGGTTLTATATTANVGIDLSQYLSLSGMTLIGNAGDNALTGSIGVDSISGGAGNDSLVGGEGNDTLMGGAGMDTMDGGAGDDLYQIIAAAESGIAETIADSGAMELIEVSPGEPLFDEFGYLVTDEFGNPVWAVEPVYEELFLPGEDIIEYSGASGVFVLGAGTSGIEKVRLVAGTTSGGIDASGVTVPGGLWIHGNNGANSITGTGNADTITGGLGADTLRGGGGNDTFIANSPAEVTGDVIDGGAGTDRLILGAGSDKFAPGAGVNVEIIEGRNIDGSALTAGITLMGDEQISSTIIGGAGNDTLQGGLGNDILRGGAGSDHFFISSLSQMAGDTIDGGAGNDELVFTHTGSEAPLTGALLQLAGLNLGSVLLLGMGGQLGGIEEIRIGNANGSSDTGPASLIADGSLGLGLLADILGNTQELSLEQIQTLQATGVFNLVAEGSQDFASAYAYALDSLNLPPDTPVDSISAEQWALFIDLLGMPNFTQMLLEAMPGSLFGIGSYNPNFVTAGLRIIGSDGDNVISGTRFTDTILGGAGNDTFIISKGSEHGLSEVLQGGAGNDELHFASNIVGDTLLLGSGVTGIEVFRVATFGAYNVDFNVNLNASRLKYAANLYGNDGNNTLTGTNYADTISGGIGDDILIGGRGNDTLNGGDGFDNMNGGLGNDTFIDVDNGINLGSLELDPKYEYVNGGAGIDTVLVAGGSTLDLTSFATRGFVGIENIDMSAGDSSLLADFSHVRESVGNGGTLTVDGGIGDTLMLVGTWLIGAPGAIYTTYTHIDGTNIANIKVDNDVSVMPVFLGTTGPDSLTGTSGDDVFLFTELTLTPGDNLNGAVGNDTLQLSVVADLPPTFELSGVTLSSIETIHLQHSAILSLDNFSGSVLGSADNDFIYITPQTSAGIDGGDGQDMLSLALGGGTASLGAAVSIEIFEVTGGGTLTLAGNWGSLGTTFLDGSYDVTLTGAFQTGALSFLGGNNSLEFSAQAVAGSVNFASGVDTVVGGTSSGNSINLGDGDDFWSYNGDAIHSYVAGGNGADTLVYTGSTPQTFFLGDQGSMDHQQGTGYQLFENLDASTASGNVIVDSTQSNSSASIKTGAGNDNILLNGYFTDTVVGGDGNDIVSGVGMGADINMGGGNDTVFLTAFYQSATIVGGAGSDTLDFHPYPPGPFPNLVDFSVETDQFAGSGSQISGFENLDASNSGMRFEVHAGTGGSVIKTGSVGDTIYLGTGADIIDTGSGLDEVIGTPTEGDTVVFGGSLFGPVEFTVDGALAADVNFSVDVDWFLHGSLIVSAASGAVVLDLTSKFQGFDTVNCATGADVTVIAGSNFYFDISTASGNDTLVLPQQNIMPGFVAGGTVNLGGGNDHASWMPSVTADGASGNDTITYAGSLDLNINLGTDSNYINFENLDASGAVGHVSAIAVATGSSLQGGGGSDSLFGGTGADTLDGGGGVDQLQGNGGNDVFLFGAAGDIPTLGDFDIILDFTVGSDQIALAHTLFTALGSPGALSPDMFLSGAGVMAAADADDHLIYDSATGALYYDADGTGGSAAVQFATLTGTPALAAADFVLV